MNRPTPRSLGYRMPAEWEPQEAVWLAWPHNEQTWPDGMLSEVESSYIQIIDALHLGQKIIGQRIAESLHRACIDRLFQNSHSSIGSFDLREEDLAWRPHSHRMPLAKD